MFSFTVCVLTNDNIDVTNILFKEYNAELEWIKNVYVSNYGYEKYKLRYIWHNANGYDVYFRLSGYEGSLLRNPCHILTHITC